MKFQEFNFNNFDFNIYIQLSENFSRRSLFIRKLLKREIIFDFDFDYADYDITNIS